MQDLFDEMFETIGAEDDDAFESNTCAAFCGLSVSSGVFGLLTGIFGAITVGLVAKCNSCYTGELEDNVLVAVAPETEPTAPAEAAVQMTSDHDSA